MQGVESKLRMPLVLVPDALQGRISRDVAVDGVEGHIIFPPEQIPEGPQFPFLRAFFPDADPCMNTSRSPRLQEGYRLSHQVGLNLVPSCLYIEFFDLSRQSRHHRVTRDTDRKSVV